MLLFATAGGGGEAYDMCCFCPLLMGILATMITAVVSLKHGTPRTAVIAIVIAALVGVIVIQLVASMKPTDDPDEHGGQETQWLLFWFWVVATVIALVAAVAAIIRRFGSTGDPNRRI